MFKRKPSSGGAAVATLIGAQTRISGDVHFAGGLHLEGTVHGNVVADGGVDSFLTVSEHGCIEGSVFAASVLLNGTVTGDIDAARRVELGARARVLGNVSYTVIETAVGAQIHGKLIHRAPAAPEPARGTEADPPGSNEP